MKKIIFVLFTLLFISCSIDNDYCKKNDDYQLHSINYTYQTIDGHTLLIVNGDYRNGGGTFVVPINSPVKVVTDTVKVFIEKPSNGISTQTLSELHSILKWQYDHKLENINFDYDVEVIRETIDLAKEYYRYNP